MIFTGSLHLGATFFIAHTTVAEKEEVKCR